MLSTFIVMSFSFICSSRTTFNLGPPHPNPSKDILTIVLSDFFSFSKASMAFSVSFISSSPLHNNILLVTLLCFPIPIAYIKKASV